MYSNCKANLTLNFCFPRINSVKFSFISLFNIIKSADLQTGMYLKTVYKT